jgi:hypothetical protein
MLDTRPRRRPVRPPLPLEPAPAEPVAQRHLQSVSPPAPLIVDVGPQAVVDEPLRRAS